MLLLQVTKLMLQGQLQLQLEYPLKQQALFLQAPGSNAKATGTGAVGIGVATRTGAGATGSSSVSIGYQAGASIQESVALRARSKTTVNSGVKGCSSIGNKKPMQLGKQRKELFLLATLTTTITRQITGVAAGTKDTDAVNNVQLKSLDERS